MGHFCPVCGYGQMEDPPRDFNICPCCGTEFEHDDFGLTPSEVEAKRAALRFQWLATGGKWFDPGTPPPRPWNSRAAMEQVLTAKLGVSIKSPATTQRFSIVFQLAQLSVARA